MRSSVKGSARQKGATVSGRLTLLFFRLTSHLPLPVLYFVANIAFYLAHYVFRAGRSRTLTNLRNSFPELSEAATNKLAARSSRNFIIVAIECFKMMAMTPDKIRKHVRAQNLDSVTSHLDKGQSVILLAAHHCNWEWVLLSYCAYMPAPVEVLYTPMKVDAVDYALLKMRTRLGATMVSAKGQGGLLMKSAKPVRVIAVGGDQAPGWSERKHWVQFLNQDTAFHMSIQRIARLTGYPVFFAKTRRIKRGHYEVDFEQVGFPPYDRGTQVLDRFAQVLEAHIREYPEDWLWAYRRWKYDRSVDDH